MGIGVYTRHALEALRDRSKAMTVAAPPAALLPPKEIPPPSSEEQAAILDEVRDYALNFSGNLPDFICTQVTKRYGAPKPGTKYGGSAKDDPRWQSFDELTMRLSLLQPGRKTTSSSSTTIRPPCRIISRWAGRALWRFRHHAQEDFRPLVAVKRITNGDHWGTLRAKRVMAFAYRIEQSRDRNTT